MTSARPRQDPLPTTPPPGPEPSRPHPAEPTTLARDGEPPAAPVLGDDCWFLSGPTAAGKSDLAIRLARRLDAEIVSVDSMAVYRGLDVGTAKPEPAHRAAVPHHALDLVDPHAEFSVAQWLAAAAHAVA
ncbi:MAG: isopentenyl transferase family protein, partial [Planctomycetaceae bacterium]